MEEYVLVIIEVNQPGKGPDLRHTAIGSWGGFSTSGNFVKSAIEYLRESAEWEKGATFTHRKTIPFTSRKNYINYLETQLDDFINSLK